MGVEFLAKKSAETWHKGYAILLSLGTFAGARADVGLAMSYQIFLAEGSFGDFLSVVHSPIPGEEALNGKADRKRWTTIINAGKEGREKESKMLGEGDTLQCGS